jgi:hypothetical protein
MIRVLGKFALLLAVGAALAMAADVAFVLPRAARWVTWGAWIATAAFATIAAVVRPLVRRLSWNDLAALAERGEPSLGERMTSAVALLRQQPHGSPELIAALVDDATGRVAQVDLTRAISVRGACAWLLAGVIAVGLVVLPAVVKPDPFAQLARRFLRPWADIDRVGQFAIQVVPGDQVVAVGSDLSIAATVRARFGPGESSPRGEAWLEWTAVNGKPNRVPMAPDRAASPAGHVFALTLPRLTGSFSYRATFAGDSGRWHQIKVVDAPAVVSLKANVEPPSYTKRSAAPARDPARIEAWEDSRVALEIEANRPLKQVELTWPAIPSPGSSTAGPAATDVVALKSAGDGTRWSATVTAKASGPFLFTLRDQYDLENKPEAIRRVVVRADAPPTLAVVAPDEFQETSADDLLRVAVSARDDVAVAAAELHYAIERGKGSTGPTEGRVAAPLDGLETPTARGEASLPLATLALKPGDAISYRVRVCDNRPAPRGPNVVWSASHGLRIVEHSESLQSRQAAAQRDGLRARLEAIHKTTAENRHKASDLRYRADEVRRGHGAWDDAKARALAERAETASAVSDQLELLSRDLEAHATFHPLARPARQVAEVENQAAQAALATARRVTEPASRHAALEQVVEKLGIVIWKVEELKRKFDELARLDDDRRRLLELARREDELAMRADLAATAGQRPELEALAREQERLRGELDEYLKNAPSPRAEVLTAQAQEADALAAQARALAEKQRDEARRTADDGPRSAAVKALAARQRALEDDARRLAVRLDEPLAQNSRGRMNVDVLARTGDAIERGDLDHARDRASEAENALNRLTNDVEDVPDDPKALARRLARRQDALRNETAEAVRESREHPPRTPEGKATLIERLKPLIDRQDAIARLAGAISAPPDQKDAARDAAQKSATVSDDLRQMRHKDVEAHQNEARDALNRLADALPEVNQRRDRARQKLAEARSRSEEIARDLEKHLSETEPKPGQPHDPVRAAAELAERLAPLARREREVAEALSAIDPEPRAVPHRDRAARRARELADSLEAIRQQVPGPAARETGTDEPRPLVAWRLVGVFPIDGGPPLAIDKPVDLGAKFTDKKGQPAVWKPSAPVDAEGTIDIGQLYGREDRSAAFGYSEISRPTARAARMLVGSDDTLTVWLNGKMVYDFRGDRSYRAATDRVDVWLVEGANRILVKCGNGNGEWKFSVAFSEDSAHDPAKKTGDLAHEGSRFEQLRQAMPALQVAARSALDRLQQKLDGQTPAEDLAAALAADQLALKAAESQAPPDRAAPAELAATERRIANALANIEAPDAPLAKAEAIRHAEEAARAIEAAASDSPPARAREAVDRAASSALALARRLGEEQSPRERIPDDPAGKKARPLDDPALGMTPADRADAAALAQRQRHIREELQAILGKSAPSQRDLRERSTALASAVAGLRDRSAAISPHAQWPAQAAADELGRAAPESMARAGAGLHRGRTSDALRFQRQAADQVEQAARHTEDLAAALRADRPADAAEPATDGLGAAHAALRAAAEQLAQARARTSSANETSAATRAAAAAMRKAAQGLSRPDRSSRGPSRARETATPTNDAQPAVADQGSPDLAGLKAAVRAQTGRAWGELPGHLRTEILQMSQGRYRDDYARLIELYFREIASDADNRGARP